MPRAVRPILVALLALALAGCQAPPSPDAAVIAELRTATVATMDAMGLPADQRPAARQIDEQVGLLAIQSPAARQQAIRSGAIDGASVLRAAETTLLDLARLRPGLSAPALLRWLVANPRQLTREQVLLVDALTAQVEREAKLKDRR